jgi:arylsulfatase A-like enzyme
VPSPAAFPRLLAAVLVAAVATGCAPDRESDSDDRAPRVVLLISIDTLRADHLGVYGYPRPTSPVIDGLGREGVVFEDASSTAPWTLPAHASMLTGLYPNRHGLNGTRRKLHKDLPTLATELAQRGYATAAAVNSIRVGRLYGLARGFQEYLYVEEVADRMSPSTWITEQALEWMREFRNQRLFLFLHYFDVHSDYTSLPEYEQPFVAPYDGQADGSSTQLFLFAFDPKLLEACRANPERESCRTWARARIDASVARVEFDDADRRHLIDLYDAGVRQMDAELGRLLESLRSDGLLDECLLILTSDHGEEFLEHGGVSHSHTQYQELLRVPLILRGPGIPAGTRVAAPVTLVDVVPTVLAALGEEAPIWLDGLDLSPLWRVATGSKPSNDDIRFRERYLFAEADSRIDSANTLQSIRRGRYKLHYDRRTGAGELYDLDEDPGEQTDIAEREPAIADALRTALLARAGSAPTGETIELSDDDYDRLRALGYLQ